MTNPYDGAPFDARATMSLSSNDKWHLEITDPRSRVRFAVIEIDPTTLGFLLGARGEQPVNVNLLGLDVIGKHLHVGYFLAPVLEGDGRLRSAADIESYLHDIKPPGVFARTSDYGNLHRQVEAPDGTRCFQITAHWYEDAPQSDSERGRALSCWWQNGLPTADGAG